jgi:hypothetical protein
LLFASSLSFFTFLQPDLPDLVLDAGLTILTQISGTFSTKYDFTLLISHLWLLLPRSSAFDAISGITAANVEAAFIIATAEYFREPSFSSLFRCFRFRSRGASNPGVNFAASTAIPSSWTDFLDPVCIPRNCAWRHSRENV